MIKFELNQESRGWFDIEMDGTDERLKLSISYISDGIENLINSLCLLAEGNSETVAVLQSEPGEYRFVFKNINDQCLFEIYEFDKNFYSGELERRCRIFIQQIERRRLLKEFLREFKKLNQLDNVEYKRVWGHDFPSKSYNRFLLDCKELEKA